MRRDGRGYNHDPAFAGTGIASFSMHPSQILAVKKEILHSDTQQLAPLAQKVLQAEDTEQLNDAMQALHNA